MRPLLLAVSICISETTGQAPQAEQGWNGGNIKHFWTQTNMGQFWGDPKQNFNVHKKRGQTLRRTDPDNARPLKAIARQSGCAGTTRRKPPLVAGHI